MSSPPRIAPAQVNILLVDDRDDKLLALEVTLESLGHNLVKARSGAEALQLLLKDEFAVILLDVSMPMMDGFETAALIRQRPSSETTPIIFVTAVGVSPDQMAQGYSLGAVDYILTPLIPEVLRAKVSVFVDLFRKTEQVRLQMTAREHSEREIQRLNVELQHRVSALLEVNRELESFNYSISHDLRAPLRSMQSFSQALLEDSESKLSAEAVDFVGRIIRSGKYMDTLLQDLLTYSRLARAEIDPATVDLDTALREVLNQLHKDIKDKGAKIEVISPLGEVTGHLPTIKQILSNLIGNALKFVPPAVAPQLRISSDSLKQRVRVIVQDNGIGIERDHQKKIFGLFERLHPLQAYPGTGIGLALVRKGAERMGGEVGVDSEPNEGSRFWFELPVPASRNGGAE